jgi:hypothetical protein
MKCLTGLAVLILGSGLVLLFTGCVPVTYTKTVTVQKNAAGQVVGSTETESVTEPHSEIKHIQEIHDTTFENLK